MDGWEKKPTVRFFIVIGARTGGMPSKASGLSQESAMANNKIPMKSKVVWLSGWAWQIGVSSAGT